MSYVLGMCWKGEYVNVWLVKKIASSYLTSFEPINGPRARRTFDNFVSNAGGCTALAARTGSNIDRGSETKAGESKLDLERKIQILGRQRKNSPF